MKELIYIRPSYETRDGHPSELADAHRAMRMAIAVAEVLELPFALVSGARDALERVENSRDDEPWLTASEVATLADLVEHVLHSLDAALDQDNRPRGALGERIQRDAGKPSDPDFDRVFELDDDGRAMTAYPRMSIHELQDTLPALAQFLRDAAARGAAVAVVE
jgi:hypothetical protein